MPSRSLAQTGPHQCRATYDPLGQPNRHYDTLTPLDRRSNSPGTPPCAVARLQDIYVYLPVVLQGP